MSKSVGRSKAAKKTRKNNKDLESANLFEEDQSLDDIDISDDTDYSDSEDEDEDEYEYQDNDLAEGKRIRERRGPSISKEINKMMDGVMDGDMAIPAIGLGLVAIIGFAMYKGVKM